jgi:hypothetical protein
MNQRFQREVEQLEPRFKRLVSMSPVTIATLPKDMPSSGVYLFSEGGRHLYVGRSRRLRQRLRYHGAARFLEASFAFLLAREATGFAQPTYKKAGSRRELQSNPRFEASFRAACRRIAGMEVRFVEETDPVRQALLEIYAAVSLDTKYNKFATT